jgi:hypothetical protein
MSYQRTLIGSLSTQEAQDPGFLLPLSLLNQRTSHWRTGLIAIKNYPFFYDEWFHQNQLFKNNSWTSGIAQAIQKADIPMNSFQNLVYRKKTSLIAKNRSYL